MDPALREMIAAGDPGEIVEAILRLEPGANALPPQVRPVARFADIVTVRLRRGDIEPVWGHAATLSLKAPRILEIDAPDRAVAAEWSDFMGLFGPVRPQVTRRRGFGGMGRGTVIGVIDWGFDFALPAFRRPDGSSRILALWDQRGGARPDGPRFGYGRRHRRAAIDAALATPRPYAALGYHPGDADRGTGSHGTHVADIAGGTTRADGGGLAPEAEYVFVHMGGEPLGGLANLGDSVRLLEALAFIAETAGRRPFVINMSIGRHGGPHTGLTLVEQALDRFLEAAPDRMIVQSGGNYYMAGAHASGRVAPGGRTVLDWITRPGDPTVNELELWYPSRDRFLIGLRAPGADQPVLVPLGAQRGLFTPHGAEIARAYHRAYDPNTPDHQFEAFLRPNAPPGRWEVSIEGETVEDGRWHAWIERDGGPREQSRFAPGTVRQEGTVGSICNGFLTVAVGAADLGRPGPLRPARFASSGPTRDGRQKPDLCAPGTDIWAARSTPRSSAVPVGGLTRMSGASQAAPYVTGMAACLLSSVPRGLDIHALRRRLFALVRPLSPGDPAVARLGAGLADPALARSHERIAP